MCQWKLSVLYETWLRGSYQLSLPFCASAQAWNAAVMEWIAASHTAELRKCLQAYWFCFVLGLEKKQRATKFTKYWVARKVTSTLWRQLFQKMLSVDMYWELISPHLHVTGEQVPYTLHPLLHHYSSLSASGNGQFHKAVLVALCILTSPGRSC